MTVASTAGGEIPLDAGSLSDNFMTDFTRKFQSDEEALGLLKNSIALASVDLESVDCLYMTGGHGVYADFCSKQVTDAINSFYAGGKVVAAG